MSLASVGGENGVMIGVWKAGASLVVRPRCARALRGGPCRVGVVRTALARAVGEERGGRRAGCAAGRRAPGKAGRPRSEAAAVCTRPGRFVSVSRLRIYLISASNPGASSPTMAAARTMS